MSSDRRRMVRSTYQVALPGQVGPAVLRPLEKLGVGHTACSTVFWLEGDLGQQTFDIAAKLQAHGLVLLDIRRVETTQEAAPAHTPPDAPEDTP